MRTTKELRDKIEAAATVSGRSLVQEVEFRLEQSFQMDDAAKQSETVAVKAALKVVEDLLARGASAKALGLAVERVGAAAAEADFEKDLTKKEDDNGKAS
jgi:adenine/guanine phosphoribosyltransferase-like PRPP-binding protein